MIWYLNHYRCKDSQASADEVADAITSNDEIVGEKVMMDGISKTKV